MRELEEILREIRDLRHWHVPYSKGFTVRRYRQCEASCGLPVRASHGWGLQHLPLYPRRLLQRVR